MAIQGKNGIYCIEGLWVNNVRDKTTVLPILELLEKTSVSNYIYNKCATKAELEFYLDEWKNKINNKKYPILYLAFHGEKHGIVLSGDISYTLDMLSTFLEGIALGKVIYFGSCSTLNISEKLIQDFLEKIGAIAAIGYKRKVHWIKSSACDLLVFDALQLDKLDKIGINKIHKSIFSDYGNLHEKLGLRVIVNDRQHFPRRREKDFMNHYNIYLP